MFDLSRMMHGQKVKTADDVEWVVLHYVNQVDRAGKRWNTYIAVRSDDDSLYPVCNLIAVGTPLPAKATADEPDDDCCPCDCE